MDHTGKLEDQVSRRHRKLRPVHLKSENELEMENELKTEAELKTEDEPKAEESGFLSSPAVAILDKQYTQHQYQRSYQLVFETLSRGRESVEVKTVERGFEKRRRSTLCPKRGLHEAPSLGIA